ncbi:hypothetical protein Ahia01_000791700 [Argonauta hians]
MGVTDLWSVLDPIKEHLPLSILGGQKLAVDLSIWICEAQGSKQLEATINKPFLRNLFFRVNHLLHLGIDLVFVIDGRAPEIKAGTIHRRQNERFLYGKSIRNNFHQPKTTKRSNLNAAVKECCELLDCLGVPYVESHGEAEAYCAFLNKNGLVDACLTNDGDAFLYGAKKVYRNFTMDRKDPHVESYNMQHIQQHLQFNQERLVAFALLTGCDYQPKGVPHVGVETALKLLRSLVNIDILSRFRQWKTMEFSECFCGIEKSVKEKASKLPEFPSEQIIQEFLVSKDVLPKKNLQWKSPNMKKFENFVVAKMDWEKGYAVQRVLPLVTRWIMLEKLGLVNTKPYGLHLTPVKILKNRVCKGVASVEVEWNVSGSTDPEPYVTVEDKEMVSQSFPDLMEQFLQDLQNSAKAKAASKVKSKKGNHSQKPNADPDPNQQVLLLSMKGLSLTANKPAVHSTTIHPKHTNQTLSRHDVSSHSSNNPTNSITECTKEPIGLLQHSVIEIDSSSDEDSDDSLFLPVSHKLQDRYNISIDSDNESTFFPTQCSILPSSDQGPTSRNMIAKVDPGTGKLENLKTLETQESLDVSEQKIESCGDVPLERFAGDVSNCHVIHDNQNRQDTSQIYPGIGRSFSTDITQLCNDMVQGSFSTDATQLCNDTRRGSFSTDHTQLCNDTVLGSFSTNVTQLCSDPVEGSFSADVTLLCTDPLVRSFGTDTTQLCSETVVKPSSSSSSSATVQRSFSTNSTQLCADTAESSFFTNPTQVCTDTVERSFSAASTQPCHNTTESSFFTNTTQLCTDTVERSFSTVATQLCNDTVQGSFSTDATQVCNDTVQGSFSTNSTQLCTETTESSFFTDPTQLCNDTVERSFSTASTQPCHDSAESSFFTNATQLCTDTVERSFSTAATQLCPAEEDSPTTYVRAPRSNVLTSYLPNTAAPQVYPDPSKFIPLADTPRSLCVCQAMPQTIQHNQNHLASTTEPYPGISDSFFQMSFNGTVQDASCIYTNVNDSINGVSNDDTLLSPSLISERKLLSKDSDICAHTQHDNSSLLVIHNNSAVSIKSKSLPLSSGSSKNQSVCNSSLKDSGSIFIDDANNNGNNNDTEFNFVDGKNNAEILNNCCVISKDSLNTTKCKSNIPENVLSSDFGNLDQTQSESGLCKYIAATAAAGTTVGEFHVEDTPEKGISICNTDPSEESIPFSSFEDNSLIMNLSSNMTPKSFQPFNESRAGNFELISSLLDNSSGVDFDSTKTSDDSILKRCLINSTVKKHMKLNNLDRNKSLDSSKTKPFLNLSPYSRSIKRISTPVESPNYGNYSSSPSDVSAIEKSSLTSVPPEKLSPNSQKINMSGFYSDDEGIIDISTYRITPDRYSQTPPQQRNSSHLKGGGYLHSFEDSFSPFADSNILTPEPVNQSQLLKHYQDDIGSSPGTVVDTGSTNMKTGTGVHEDSCHEDFSKDLKPPPESPLPLIMRLGKHFNSQRIKNLKK